jgi:hypothetical protein
VPGPGPGATFSCGDGIEVNVAVDPFGPPFATTRYDVIHARGTGKTRDAARNLDHVGGLNASA